MSKHSIKRITLTEPSSWQYEGSTCDASFGELPISKMLKHELTEQIQLCQNYLRLKEQYLESSWQPLFLGSIFKDCFVHEINSRIDALTMALALKNKKRQRVRADELLIKPVVSCSSVASTEPFACDSKDCGTCNTCIDIC